MSRGVAFVTGVRAIVNRPVDAMCRGRSLSYANPSGGLPISTGPSGISTISVPVFAISAWKRSTRLRK